MLKLWIVDSDSCILLSVVSNTKVSLLALDSYEVTPLNPLLHPVKDESVLPVYVMISSSILNNP